MDHMPNLKNAAPGQAWGSSDRPASPGVTAPRDERVRRCSQLHNVYSNLMT